MAKDGMISITIENADLNAMVTEYAQENANLRLTQKALIRRVGALQIELAATKKGDENAVESGQKGQRATPVEDREKHDG